MTDSTEKKFRSEIYGHTIHYNTQEELQAAIASIRTKQTSDFTNKVVKDSRQKLTAEGMVGLIRSVDPESPILKVIDKKSEESNVETPVVNTETNPTTDTVSDQVSESPDTPQVESQPVVSEETPAVSSNETTETEVVSTPAAETKPTTKKKK